MDQATTNGEKSDGGQHIHYSHDHQDHRHLYSSLEQQLQLDSDRDRRRLRRRRLCPSLPQPLSQTLARLRPGPSAVLGALVCLFLSSSGGIALAIVLIVRQQQRWRKKPPAAAAAAAGPIVGYGDGDGGGDGGADDGDVSLACLARDLVLFAAAMALLYMALHIRGARWGVYGGCCSAAGSASGSDGGGGGGGEGGNKSNRSSTSGGGASSTGGAGTLPTTITTTTTTAAAATATATATGAGTGTATPTTTVAAAAGLPPHICGNGENYLRTSALLVARLAIAVWVGALVASAIVISRAPDGRRIGAVPVLNLLFCIGAIIPFLILSATIEKKHPAPFATAGFSKPSFLTCRVSAFADDLEASATGGDRDRDAADSEALLNMSISRRASIERAKQQQMMKNNNNNNNNPPPSPPQPSYNPGGWRSEWNEVAEQVGVSCRIPVSESDYSARDRVAEENGPSSNSNSSNNVAPPAPTYITSCYSSGAYAAPLPNTASSSVPPPPVPLKLSKGGPLRGNIDAQHNTDNRHEQKQKQAGHDHHNYNHNHNPDHHRNNHTYHSFNPESNPNPNYNYNYNYHHSNGNNYIPRPPPPPPPVPSTSISSGERRSGLSTVRYAARPDVAVQQPLRVFVPAPAPAPAPMYAPISIPASADSGGIAGGSSSGNQLYTHNRPRAATTFSTSTTTVEPPPPMATARTTRRVYTAYSPDASRRITDVGAGGDVDLDHGLNVGRTNQSIMAAPPPPPPHTTTTTGYESYGYSTMRPDITTGETITTTTTTSATTDPATAAVSMLRNAQRAQKVQQQQQQQQQRGHLVGLGILGNGRLERAEDCDDGDKDQTKGPEVKIPGAYVEDCPE